LVLKPFQLSVVYWVPAAHGFTWSVTEILADTLEDMDLKQPAAEVDIAQIRRKYHAAAVRQAQRGGKPPKVSHKK